MCSAGGGDASLDDATTGRATVSPGVAQMTRAPKSPGTPLHFKQLPGSKWTAVEPVDRGKHFVVVATLPPVTAGEPPERVVLEAVHSRRQREIEWRELRESARWRRGWL